MSKLEEILSFIRTQFPKKDFIPLHEPLFIGNESKYVQEAIDSTFVSSVGKFVNQFEEMMAKIAETNFAIATCNGTSALHMSLLLLGVERRDEIITQALSFVATANAITYLGANAIFLDVDNETMGLSPDAIERFLEANGEARDGICINKSTGNKISACVPMHTFGHPCKIDRIVEICNEWNIPVVEDAAESLGSRYKGKHTGGFGKVGAFSFNGNKIVTCGGGGAIVTNDEDLAKKAKHLTTQAKIAHKWEYNHDNIGYNYRMPNLNAAMACAQLEMLDKFLQNKRELAHLYQEFFGGIEGISFKGEPDEASSNYWLNAIEFRSLRDRDQFLEDSNSNSVMTRPIWKLLSELPMYKRCQNDGLNTSRYLEERIVNIPSSVNLG